MQKEFTIYHLPMKFLYLCIVIVVNKMLKKKYV